jgi:protease I
MADLTGRRVAIRATQGFEVSELDAPKRRLAEMGAERVVVSPGSGEIRGRD